MPGTVSVGGQAPSAAVAFPCGTLAFLTLASCGYSLLLACESQLWNPCHSAGNKSIVIKSDTKIVYHSLSHTHMHGCMKTHANIFTHGGREEEKKTAEKRILTDQKL